MSQHTHTHRNRRARLEVELLEDRNPPVFLWALDMPTSPLPHKPVLSPAEPVRGFDAAADIARPSLRQLAPSLPGQGRTIAAKEAAPAGPRRETFAPWSAELAVTPARPISRVAPPSLGITAAAVGFGTLTATAAFESRSLGWSVGFVGENNAARWLDPFVSRQIDVGPVAPPRAFSESSSDFVEQFVDWNADNDNGSLVTDYIPAVRDYEVGFTPDENDVVPLTLVAVPPGGIYPGIVEHVRWRLQVSYTGTGRLRFWESPDKQNELTPSDDWQFTPHGDPRLQGQGRVPNVYLEGMEMSSEVRDITVTFSTLTFFEGMNAPVLQHFKQVKVAVTPVIGPLNVSEFFPARFDNYGLYPPDGYGGTANYLVGRIVFEVSYVPRNNNHNVYFMQNVTAVKNDVGNGEAMTLLNGKRLKWLPKERDKMPAVPPSVIGNYDFPFLDIPPNSNVPFPFYSLVEHDTGQLRTRNPGTRDSWLIKAEDNPWISIRKWESPVAKVDILFEATMYVVVWHHQPDRPQNSVISAVKAIDWWIRFGAGEYSHVDGGMKKLFKIYDKSAERKVAPNAGQRAPVIFNDAMEVRPG